MNSDENHQNRIFKTLDLVPEIKRHVRIADILAGKENFDGDENLEGSGMSVVVSRRHGRSVTSLQCASPRRIISRCLAALKPTREKRALFRSDGVSAAREFAGISPHASCSKNIPTSVDSPVSAPESDDSGRCRTDASFNLGVACGLVYLISAGRNEMNKMIEVRKQMESLLQNLRGELQNKNSTVVSNGVNNLASSTDSDPQISLEMNSPWTNSYAVPKSETVLGCDDDSSRSPVDEIEQHCVGQMNELEAELESELELLEINLDTGHSSKLPHQRKLEIVLDSSSSSSSSWSLSHSPNSGDVVIKPQEIHSEAQREVSPIELERRLHELLEARQEERIQELEEALEYTKTKLREKEIEVSWWKDTARIISHQVPESPPVVYGQNLKTLHLSR